MPWKPDDVDGIGLSEPKLERQRHPRTLYQHWLAAVEGPADAAGSWATFGDRAFMRGINTLRKVADDKEIKRAFLAFASDVHARRVTVRGRPAWLVFYGRRHKYLGKSKPAAEGRKADHVLPID